MTIFLEVLKKLISEQLHPLVSALHGKANSYVHNHALSMAQYNIVYNLSTKVLGFKGKDGDDNYNYQAIKSLIEHARAKIQEERERHRAGDDGETTKCLNNLSSHIIRFYDKLDAFKFTLLNKANVETPENIIYFHCTYYLGDDIFTPAGPQMNEEIRKAKEGKIVERLESLVKFMATTTTAYDKKKDSLKVLKDLAKDNHDLVSGKIGIPIPGISLVGFTISVPKKLFGVSEGRLGTLIKDAITAIEKLKIAAPKSDDHKEREHEARARASSPSAASLSNFFGKRRPAGTPPPEDESYAVPEDAFDDAPSDAADEDHVPVPAPKGEKQKPAAMPAPVPKGDKQKPAAVAGAAPKGDSQKHAAGAGVAPKGDSQKPVFGAVSAFKAKKPSVSPPPPPPEDEPSEGHDDDHELELDAEHGEEHGSRSASPV